MKANRLLKALLVLSFILSLVGCSKTAEPASTTFLNSETTLPGQSSVVYEMRLTQQQLNSFSMLYHLAIISEEIRSSKDNRLMLDEIYTSLLNDINPGAIDKDTQDQLSNLRNTIRDYIGISVKRERLQYIYNQNKASAIRSAVPNPLAILSMTNALDWKKLAVNVVFTAVDSYTNYKNASNSADQEFLMSGWDLDDEERDAVQKNRDRAFDYMVNIVRNNNLDGKLTLNEELIENFAKICEIKSTTEKIHRLEAEKNSYKLLGNYWLELADCYFENNQYDKCLDCVNEYKNLSMNIYRKDYNYVQILPKAIVAAQNVYDGDADAYITNVESFAKEIEDNTSTNDWSVRYFAAQVYLDLYAKTNNSKYLKEKAYKFAYDNVTVLLDEQRALNVSYLGEVKELEIKKPEDEPDYKYLSEDQKKEREKEYKEELKKLKEYNKALKETRKTELSPLYEPLILNCDLLFALAEKINISDSEKKDIDEILHDESSPVFLSQTISERYSFKPSNKQSDINLSKDTIVIPALLLTDDATVVVTVSDGTKSEIFNDFTVNKVERDGDAIGSFNAYYSSEKMKDFKWKKDTTIKIEICSGGSKVPVVFNYRVSEFKENWIFGDTVVFVKE